MHILHGDYEGLKLQSGSRLAVDERGLGTLTRKYKCLTASAVKNIPLPDAPDKRFPQLKLYCADVVETSPFGEVNLVFRGLYKKIESAFKPQLVSVSSSIASVRREFVYGTNMGSGAYLVTDGALGAVGEAEIIYSSPTCSYRYLSESAPSGVGHSRGHGGATVLKTNLFGVVAGFEVSVKVDLKPEWVMSGRQSAKVGDIWDVTDTYSIVAGN